MTTQELRVPTTYQAGSHTDQRGMPSGANALNAMYVNSKNRHPRQRSGSDDRHHRDYGSSNGRQHRRDSGSDDRHHRGYGRNDDSTGKVSDPESLLFYVGFDAPGRLTP